MDKEDLFGVKDDIRVVLTRRSDAIFSSIYELFCFDDPDQISLTDIINRLMLLIQTPATFVLAKFDTETNTIKDEKNSYINFNPYPKHDEKIRDAIKEAKLSKYFFTIFGVTDYRLLVFLTNQKETPTDNRDYNFTVLSNKYDMQHIDERIFSFQLNSVLNGEEYENRFGKNFLSRLQSVVYNYIYQWEGFKQESKEITTPSDKSEYKYWYKNFLKGLSNDYHGYGIRYDGVIDKIFKKYEKSLKMISANNSDSDELKSDKLTNFLFFIRDYSGYTQRKHPVYPYGLRLLICSKQEEDIKKYFKNLKENVKNDDSLKYWYTEKIKGDTDYKAIGKEVNDRFWGMLTNDEDKFGELIEILKGRFKNTTYSMTDQVFISGIIHFRNPSVNGGLHRSLPEDKIGCRHDDLSLDEQNELLRLVIVHYLFLGMSGVSQAHESNFMVMLCPVSIGGRILGVTGYVTSNSSDKKEINEMDVWEYSHTWRQNFHAYSSAHYRLKRVLREHMWKFYVRTVFKMYVESLEDAISCINKEPYCNLTYAEQECIAILHMEETLNRLLGYLTRFFSYNGISVKCFRNSDNVIISFPNFKKPNAATISDYMYIIFYIDGKEHKNHSFFSVFPGYCNEEYPKYFVNIPEIAMTISDHSLGYITPKNNK